MDPFIKWVFSFFTCHVHHDDGAWWTFGWQTSYPITPPFFRDIQSRASMSRITATLKNPGKF